MLRKIKDKGMVDEWSEKSHGIKGLTEEDIGNRNNMWRIEIYFS